MITATAMMALIRRSRAGVKCNRGERELRPQCGKVLGLPSPRASVIDRDHGDLGGEVVSSLKYIG